MINVNKWENVFVVSGRANKRATMPETDSQAQNVNRL